MLTCMDDLTAPLVDADPGAGADPAGGHPARVAARPHVVVIGATNRPDALDPALRCGANCSWLLHPKLFPCRSCFPTGFSYCSRVRFFSCFFQQFFAVCSRYVEVFWYGVKLSFLLAGDQ